MRIVATPFGTPVPPADGPPRRVAPDVIAAAPPGPARDRLARGEVLVVTTGQQPGLFTGPLYTIYKALSAVALARRVARERATPVVPVFWVAGDDHDFAEANHAWFLNPAGDLAQIVLRQRPADAPLRPLARELCGPEITAALEALAAGTPDSEFKAPVLDWLAQAFRPDASLADAFAHALTALLGPRGEGGGELVIFRAHDPAAKRAMAPWLLKALAVTLPDGLSPVMVEGRAGRDRLRPAGDGFVTRRGGERFSRAELERIAAEAPERLSPNVLLRPAIEAALFPTVAYAAGPGELAYLPDAAPLFAALGVRGPAAVPRWSGVLVESRVEKLMEKHGLLLEGFTGAPGALEAQLVRETLPPEATDLFAALRARLDDDYGRLARAVAGIDPTLERPVQSARNAALAGTQEIEKKLIASLKRANETLVGQIARARAAVYPRGEPQERVLTIASFLIRHGPALLDAVDAEVARWAAAS